MAAVEGVARNNRTAWERINAGVPADGADGGLASVRAPPSVGRYDLRGAGGGSIAFESALVPPSVATAAGSAEGSSRRPASLPPPPRAVSMPVIPVKKTAGAGAGRPPRSVSPVAAASVISADAPARAVHRAARVVVPSPTPNGTAADGADAGKESDSASIASYPTARSTLDDLSASPPLPAPPRKDESDVSASTASAGPAGASRCA
ncbi:hypothetical protein BC834DRAFT_973483 [Gloeopeniophorella convolvens]|nr:hypothetical protein BC834DRAFT_973483 [Gloeopeniophorella convolvens]